MHATDYCDRHLLRQDSLLHLMRCALVARRCLQAPSTGACMNILLSNVAAAPVAATVTATAMVVHPPLLLASLAPPLAPPPPPSFSPVSPPFLPLPPVL